MCEIYGIPTVCAGSIPPATTTTRDHDRASGGLAVLATQRPTRTHPLGRLKIKAIQCKFTIGNRPSNQSLATLSMTKAADGDVDVVRRNGI